MVDPTRSVGTGGTYVPTVSLRPVASTEATTKPSPFSHLQAPVSARLAEHMRALATVDETVAAATLQGTSGLLGTAARQLDAAKPGESQSKLKHFARKMIRELGNDALAAALQERSPAKKDFVDALKIAMRALAEMRARFDDAGVEIDPAVAQLATTVRKLARDQALLRDVPPAEIMLDDEDVDVAAELRAIGPDKSAVEIWSDAAIDDDTIAALLDGAEASGLDMTIIDVRSGAFVHVNVDDTGRLSTDDPALAALAPDRVGLLASAPVSAIAGAIDEAAAAGVGRLTLQVSGEASVTDVASAVAESLERLAPPIEIAVLDTDGKVLAEGGPFRDGLSLMIDPNATKSLNAYDAKMLQGLFERGFERIGVSGTATFKRDGSGEWSMTTTGAAGSTHVRHEFLTYKSAAMFDPSGPDDPIYDHLRAFWTGLDVHDKASPDRPDYASTNAANALIRRMEAFASTGIQADLLRRALERVGAHSEAPDLVGFGSHRFANYATALNASYVADLAVKGVDNVEACEALEVYTDLVGNRAPGVTVRGSAASVAHDAAFGSSPKAAQNEIDRLAKIVDECSAAASRRGETFEIDLVPEDITKGLHRTPTPDFVLRSGRNAAAIDAKSMHAPKLDAQNTQILDAARQVLRSDFLPPGTRQGVVHLNLYGASKQNIHQQLELLSGLTEQSFDTMLSEAQRFREPLSEKSELWTRVDVEFATGERETWVLDPTQNWAPRRLGADESFPDLLGW